MTRHRWWMLAVLVLALGLRVWGLGYGLPDLFHQDEPIVVNHALAMGVNGLNPNFFVLPGFVLYLVFVVSGLVCVAGMMAGVYASVSDFGFAFVLDPSTVYWASRFAAGVIPGVVNVWLVSRLAGRHAGRIGAIVASVLLACCYLHVQHSHYIYTDILLALAVTAFVLFLERGMERGARVADYLAAGAAFGWGMSIKYTMMFFIPAFIVMHGLVWRREMMKTPRWMGLAIIFGAAAGIVFFAFSPYVFLDMREALAQIRYQSGAQRPVGWGHHLLYSLVPGVGWPLLCAAVLGLVMVWKRFRPSGIVYAVSFLIYYGVMAVYSQPFARYMMPVVPLLCVLAAIGFTALAGHGKVRYAIGALVMFCLVAPNLSLAVYGNVLFTREDTRQQAKEWFESNFGSETAVALASRTYAPRLWQDPKQLEEKEALLSPDEKDGVRKERLNLMLRASAGKKTYPMYTMDVQGGMGKNARFLGVHPLIPADWDALETKGIRLVVLNYDEYGELPQEFLDELKTRARLVKTFSPYLDPNKKVSVDLHDATAAPHLPEELLSRERLGSYLEIYEVI